MTPRIRSSALLGALLALGLPGAAEAAIKLGGDLRAQALAPCSNVPTCTVIQTRLPAPAQVTAPHDGVVVRWSVRGAGWLRAFVARYVPGRGAVQTALSGRGVGRGLSTPTSFPTRLRIRRGDRVGIMLEGREPMIGALPDVPGSSADYFGRKLGLTPVGPDSTGFPWQFAYDATIEPDRDGDGYGDESQDRCPSDRTTAGACRPAAPAPDTIAPAFVGRPKIAPRRMRGTRSTRLTAVLTERATLTLQAHRMKPGRVRGGRCVTRSAPSRGRRCRRAVSAGRLTHPARAGANVFVLRPRIAGRRLRSGLYRITLRAVDAAGNAARPVRLSLRVVR